MLFLGLLAHKILREIRASSPSEKGDKRREAEDTLIVSLAPVPTYASSLGSIRLYCSGRRLRNTYHMYMNMMLDYVSPFLRTYNFSL